MSVYYPTTAPIFSSLAGGLLDRPGPTYPAYQAVSYVREQSGGILLFSAQLLKMMSVKNMLAESFLLQKSNSVGV